jgi:hypothetical protein
MNRKDTIGSRLVPLRGSKLRVGGASRREGSEEKRRALRKRGERNCKL